MRYFESDSASLAGSLLLAHPSMRDENFERTLIFISINDPEDGSFGVILNRLSENNLDEALPNEDLGPLAKTPVHFGGPVANDQLLLIAFQWHPSKTGRGQGSWSWRHDLNMEAAQEMVQRGEGVLRVFEGYTGWSKGQLERELQHNYWIVHEPGPEMLDAVDTDELWKKLVRSHGPVFEFLTSAPDNLGNN